MKPIWLSMLALASSLAFGKQDPGLTRVFLLGNRADNPAIESSLRDAYGPELRTVASETQELANTNTFVRVGEDLTGRDVVVTVPRNIPADDLMEALIKVRTAHTMGARHVTAFFETAAKRMGDGSELAKLFMVAGASKIAYYDHELLNDTPFTRPAYQPSFKTIDRVVVMDRDHPNLAGAVAERLGVPHVAGVDGLDLRSTHVMLFAPSEIPVNENFFAVLKKVRELSSAGAMVTLVTPYLPYARSDKIDQPGVTVTARLIADLIESAGAHSVVFARAHSPQAQGFFRIPTVQVDGIEGLKAGVQDLKLDAVLAPDAGFQKDAKRIAVALGLPLGQLNKLRVLDKVQILGASGADIAGKTVLIPDDETASGSTLAEGAEYAVRVLGAKAVYAAVTHLAGDAKKAIESPYIKKLIVTDSVHAAEAVAGVEVLSLADEFASALRPWVRAADCQQALIQR